MLRPFPDPRFHRSVRCRRCRGGVPARVAGRRSDRSCSRGQAASAEPRTLLRALLLRVQRALELDALGRARRRARAGRRRRRCRCRPPRRRESQRGQPVAFRVPLARGSRRRLFPRRPAVRGHPALDAAISRRARPTTSAWRRPPPRPRRRRRPPTRGDLHFAPRGDFLFGGPSGGSRSRQTSRRAGGGEELVEEGATRARRGGAEEVEDGGRKGAVACGHDSGTRGRRGAARRRRFRRPPPARRAARRGVCVHGAQARSEQPLSRVKGLRLRTQQLER